MNRAKIWLTASVATAAILSCSALAQETTTYSYDGLGRQAFLGITAKL